MMRTVKWLREELLRFPDDAVVFAYEGEVTGLVIEHSTQPRDIGQQGVIYCSENENREQKTELLPP